MEYEISMTNAGFTRRQRVDRAIHTLEGILKGIALDGAITTDEARELKDWCEDHRALIGNHPFTELIPKIDAALADGVIDSEEQADILWLCQNLSSDSIYYDDITSDIQRLQGILHGILADGHISDDEIKQLSEWVDSHSSLKGCYPYDEIDSLLTQVLRDGKVSEEERAMLSDFFEDFISYSLSKRMQNARERRSAPRQTLKGLCASCPELVFQERCYCFTGASTRAPRSKIASLVESLGGAFSSSVTPKVHFLVVGANGNPAWAYSCYGRKVEQAMKLRAEGHSLVIVHENDFWDAAQDG
ncbi:MAG: NAD-dependent DNA ligase [Verrucomicrobiaceae bacterium]|nr:NAD-dependent DNA ligase [Verrucomicrobiaceae bacterium]